MRLKLHVQYDGGGYHGWQMQPDVVSVCGELVRAFAELGLGEVDLVAAGRTDAGVHAWGQVVHVDVAKRMELIKFLGGLNRFLPPQVRVVRVAEVGEDFHARFSANARYYRYLLWDKRQLRPDLVGRVGHVRQPLDVEKMQQALDLLGVGEMDFSSLRDAECQSRTPFCRLLAAEVKRQDADIIELFVGADHFLHHMVRNLVGVLVEVGLGKRGVGALKELMPLKDRTKAAKTFAPDGLYLVRVDYPEHEEMGAVGTL